MVVDIAKRAVTKTFDRFAEFKREVRKNIATAGAAAFAFLIALAWRDAIADAVNKLISILNISNTDYLYKFLTALVITLVGVIGIWITSKIVAKEEVNKHLTKSFEQ